MIMLNACRRSRLLLLPLAIQLALADFGDYADTSFTCPARTTCPLVCVANFTDCPTACNITQKLCLDGKCVGRNETCSAQESPCPYRCAPVACAKTIDLLPVCHAKYAPWYANATACGAFEVDQIPLVSFKSAPFVFCYCWMSCITFFIITWSFFNQVMFPVKGSTQKLDSLDGVDNEMASARKLSDEFQRASTPPKMKRLRKLSDDTNNRATSTEDSTADGDVSSQIEFDTEVDSCWTQTGYRTAPISSILYLLVILTLFGIHVLLGVLTILYYVQQGAVSFLPKYFRSEVQSLQTFEMAWGVGIVFSLALQWPHSLESLFLRRSFLSHATRVAVFIPFQAEPENQKDSSSDRLHRMRKITNTSYSLFTRVMAFIFCDINRSHIPGSTVFIPIEIEEDGTRYFYFRYRRYTFDYEQSKFLPAVWHVGSTLGDYRAAANGLLGEDITKRRGVVGSNLLLLKKPSILRSVVDEFSKPFYTYQCFIVWSWFPFWYYIMALVYTGVVVFGGLTVAFFRFRQDQTLSKLSGTYGDVTVLRDGGFCSIPQSELVPGDAAIIQPGVACCDMVLVKSDGILIDESALTGESTPVFKRALDPADSMLTYDRTKHKKHTISAGTVVLESNETTYDLAIVARTGSFTAKGELLKDILSSERYQFKFDTEIKIVIFALCVEAIFGFSAVVYFLQEHPAYGFFYGIYVVATCLPPLLPTIFTVSVGISDQRLAKKRIAVGNSDGILVAGKVTKVFFDKTGTLTKQGLDFVSCRGNWKAGGDELFSQELAIGMATCHNLTLSRHGKIVGNSVDRMMFEATGATINQIEGSSVHISSASGKALKIVKHFDFDHHLAMQSVVVSDESGRLIAFVKGSGESIKRCCVTESIPSDYDEASKVSAKCGLYQLAMGIKILSDDSLSVDLSNISRCDIEQDLTFAGVINFKNVLREETPGVIQQLKAGDCQTTIITGDHVLTGICIAKEAGIVGPSKRILTCTRVEDGNAIWTTEDDCHVSIPSIESLKVEFDLAITGKAWNELNESQPQNAERLAPYIRVFGRCTPNDKVSVVTTFVNQGFITLMCGDGGNDCGALKTAHVGIALSDAEASLVSPFTSLDKCITSVLEVLKEGRCALASSLASYKFMILYGQLETMNQIVNAYFKISFGMWNWAFMDGFWTISLAFALPLARAADELSPSRPVSSLFGLHTVASAGGVLLLNLLFFIGALFLLFSQSWYLCRRWKNQDVSQIEEIGDNYESEVIWLVSGYQYISSAMAYNYGYEFRQGWFKNYVFAALVAVFTATHFVAILVPGRLSCIFRVNCDNSNVGGGDPIQNVFNTTIMPVAFRWKLVAYIIANTVTVQVYEYFVVNGFGKSIARKIKKKRELTKIEDSLEPVQVVIEAELLP